MWMFRGLCHRQYGGEAGVAALEDLAPFGARPLAEDSRELGLERVALGRPVFADRGVRVKSELLVQLAAKAGFDRRDRDLFAIGALIDIVVGGAPVHDIGATLQRHAP